MKNLLAPVLILVFISAVFVYAVSPSLQLEKFGVDEGWNLVYNFVRPDQIRSGDISQDNIKAIYAFIPNVQKYARLYPSPSEEDQRLIGLIDDDELVNTAFWVYSDKEGNSMSYSPADTVLPLEGRKLYRGWNFVGVTNDMMQSPTYPQLMLNDIKGNCNIEKIYLFVGGQWYKRETLPMQDLLYTGIVVKVSNDCQLGMLDVPPSPPAVP